MDTVQILSSILYLVAGVGVFLIACTMMSSNLEALGSKKLKSLFSKTSNNKLLGVGVGLVTTAVIQSSSATSVMTIGFVNAGIMSLTQAAMVIFGANIGTTVTGQIVALGMFGGESVSTSVIFSALAGIGAFVLAFAKRDKTKKIGGIFAGFGMLFVGLSLMSDSMAFFSELDEVKSFLAIFENPFLLVLIGTLFTALIQSSSVMTSMVITMVVTGLINLNQGIYITMGANIGTCATALIAGLTSTTNAKRTALIHVIFNVSGVVLFMLVGGLTQLFGIDYGYLFAKAFPDVPQMQMAMFHTIFNVVTVILVLPFSNLLIKAVQKIIPDKKTKTSGPSLKYVEEHLLATPPIAALQVKKEIMHMAEIASENFNIACDMVCSLNCERMEEFRQNEDALDYIQKELNVFIAKLLNTDVNEKDKLYLSTAIRSSVDFERIGDYAENLTEYAEKLNETGESFSKSAKEEIVALQQRVNELFGLTEKTYTDCDFNSLSEVLRVEEEVDDITERMAESHVKRLEVNECSPEVGAQFLSLSSNIERIADHCVNVAKTVKVFA